MSRVPVPDRPLLEEALSRIESGASDGLVVAKLDRFGRSLIHSLAAVERIQAAGGTFVSVQDGFDLSTDHGRLVLRMMLSWAEWELDRIRAGWRTARARAVARGIHMGGRPPAGYQRDEARRLQPHPEPRADNRRGLHQAGRRHDPRTRRRVPDRREGPVRI